MKACAVLWIAIVLLSRAYATSRTSLEAKELAFSAVLDNKSGDLILKIVNHGPQPERLRFKLPSKHAKQTDATETILTGDPLKARDDDHGSSIFPVSSTVRLSPAADHEAPPYSLTVLRLKSAESQSKSETE